MTEAQKVKFSYRVNKLIDSFYHYEKHYNQICYNQIDIFYSILDRYGLSRPFILPD